MTLQEVSNRPAVRATRFVVKVKGEPEFTVLVHRGSVPRERIAISLAVHETVEYIREENSL